MKTKILTTIAILICFVGISACNDKNVTSTEMKKTKIENYSIIGKWKLTAFVEEGNFKYPEVDTNYFNGVDSIIKYWFTLSFDTDTTLSGHEVVNSMRGYYEIDDSIFSMKSLASTMICCEPPDADKYSFILSWEIQSFELINTDTELKLFYNDGKNYLLFKRLTNE